MNLTYLKKRGQSYYVQLVVPVALREVIGKRVLVKALHTRDVREANRLKHAVLAEMHRDLTRATLRPTAPSLLDVARGQRRIVAEGLVDDETAEAGFDAHMDAETERLRRERGVNPETGDPHLTPADLQAAALAEKVMAGSDVELLSESISKYLAEAGKRVLVQTLEEKRQACTGFSNWLGKDVEVSAITRKVAGKYLTDWLGAKNHAPATIRKTVSNINSLFTWLQNRGVIESNPFAFMGQTIETSTRGTAPPRRPFTDAELLQLVKVIKPNDPLLPMVLLCAYTGARREEVALLKVADIERSCFIIRAGKSKAAVRSVPIHSCIAPLVDQLAATTTDAFLIPGLITGGRDDRRGHHVGKKFGRVLRAAGLSDPALVMHSLRNSFIQRCREADVPKSTYALLVGHSLAGELGYGDATGGYSQGLSAEALKKAIAKVTYGPLDALARKLSGTVKVTKKSARRPSARRNATKEITT